MEAGKEDIGPQWPWWAGYFAFLAVLLSLRAGVRFDEIQLEPFIDNLLNTHTVTNYNFSIYQAPPVPGGPTYSRLQTDYTFRPRTFGITFTYRH